MARKIKSFLNTITRAGVTPPLQESLSKRIQLTNIYALIFACIALVYGVIFEILGIRFMALLVLPIALAFLLVPAMNRVKCYDRARLFLMMTLYVAIYVYSTSLGRKSGVHFWYVVAAQIPFLVFELKNRKYLIISFSVAVVLLLLSWATDFQHSILPVVNLDLSVLHIISFCMIVFAFGVSFSMIYYLLQKYEQTLQRQKEALYKITSLESDRTLMEIKSIKNRRLIEAHVHALNTSSIVAFTDLTGTITHVNDNFCKISGYTRGELLGKTHRVLRSGYHSEEFFQHLWATILSKKIWHGEICNKAKDGRLYWVDTTIVPLLDGEGKIEQYMAMRYDITKRKQAEESLIQSAKMSALGEMAGGIAHEINNPVAIIQGKANQLLRQMRAGSATLKMEIEGLEKIISTSERITKIVKGLRLFSRKGDHDPLTHVEVKNLITEVLDLCTERFKKCGIKIEVSEIQPITVECQAVQLEQVLLNLLNNAYDAIEYLPEKWVRIEVSALAGVLQISVTDSGKGISTEIADKIMEPFFTTKEIEKGTGLGLSISRGIIESHGGKLWLDRAAPHTRFVISLPQRQQKKLRKSA